MPNHALSLRPIFKQIQQSLLGAARVKVCGLIPPALVFFSANKLGRQALVISPGTELKAVKAWMIQTLTRWPDNDRVTATGGVPLGTLKLFGACLERKL